MATHSSILAWRISWTEEPGRIQSMGVTKSGTQLNAHLGRVFPVLASRLSKVALLFY